MLGLLQELLSLLLLRRTAPQGRPVAGLSRTHGENPSFHRPKGEAYSFQAILETLNNSKAATGRTPPNVRQT